MVQEIARELHLSPSVFSIILISALLIVALAAGFILNRVFHYWTKKLENTWGELLFALVESLPLPLLLLATLYTGLEALTLPRAYERLGSKLIFALVILVIFYFPAKVVILFLRRLSQKSPELERVTQPATFIIRALFALLAIIIVLENLGISLTAVWTTLGVGSVAIALALQDTLGNFFAGFYLLVDRPIGPGDYIKLDSGHEGFVNRLGWRSTYMSTREHNVVVVPNSTLAKAVITNYSMPELRMAVALRVGVAYDSDIKRVEKTLLDIAGEAIHEGLEGLLPEPPPVVMFIPGFGDSSLDFTLVVHVREFADQFAVQSDLRKRIVERFRKDGIDMPFPTRSIIVDKATQEALAKREPKA